MITVVGWDGRPPTGRAAAALAGATLVAGGRRHLAAVPVPTGAKTVVMGDVEAALDVVIGHDGDAVVVASGDPGFFGVVRALRARGIVPVVLPAVGSVAAAFARAGLPWDDALVVSVHGRALQPAVNACRAHPKVAVLTAPGSGPAELGTALAGTARTVVVCENLGGDGEAVIRCTPEQAATRHWREPNVVLVLDEHHLTAERRWLHGWLGPDRWALPEERFAHRDGMVTKSEVRALVLARLGPRPGGLVWDVGAGSGSVAVECARLGAAAVAVDRDPDACRLARSNAAAFDVPVTVVEGAAPAALTDLPDPDAVFVGGGGTPVVGACAERRPPRLVVALAAIERIGPTHAALTAAGYAVDGVQLAANRLIPLPDGTHRLAPTNPVTVLAGELP
jgi:precorrin-6Y C5,15-methyltransferase (decarboxylating)